MTRPDAERRDYDTAMEVLHAATTDSTAWDVAWLGDHKLKSKIEQALTILGGAVADARAENERLRAALTEIEGCREDWRTRGALLTAEARSVASDLAIIATRALAAPPAAPEPTKP